MQAIAYFRDGPFLPSYEGGSKSILGMIRAFSRKRNVYLFRCYRGWEDPNLYKEQPFKTIFIKPEDFYTNKLLYKELFTKYNIGSVFFDSSEAVLLQSHFIPKNIKKIYEVINVDHVLVRRLNGSKSVVNQICKNEKQAIAKSDALLVRSKKDMDDLLSIGAPKEKLHHYFGAIDISLNEFTPYHNKKDKILFLGNMYYGPNEQAVNLILEKIIPNVLSKYPKAKFFFIGPCPPLLQQKATIYAESVKFTGEIENISEFLKTSAVGLCPVISGSGTRLKILDYLSCGIPTISTTIGIEGLHNEISKIVDVEDDLDLYADKIINILKGKLNKNNLSTGRAYVEKYYSWTTEATKILDTLSI